MDCMIGVHALYRSGNNPARLSRPKDCGTPSSKKTAVLFWQNTMYANSDIVVTPRPIHLDDKMIMWCYSRPVGYYEKLKEKFGEFNLASYWGPFASPKSSEWITNGAEYTLENEQSKLEMILRGPTK